MFGNKEGRKAQAEIVEEREACSLSELKEEVKGLKEAFQDTMSIMGQEKERRSRSGEATDSHHGPSPRRFHIDESTDRNQKDQGAHAVHSSIINRYDVDHSQGMASIVWAQLRIPALTTSSIPGSAVHGKVKQLEGKIQIIRRELKAIHTEHAIFGDPANIGALVYTLAKETQTRWFLFLRKHPQRPQVELLENGWGLKKGPQQIGKYKTLLQYIHTT